MGKIPLFCGIIYFLPFSLNHLIHMKMKNLFILITMLCAAAAHAQIDENTVLLGGDISYQTATNSGSGAITSNTSSTSMFGAGIGYFPAKNFVFGIHATYYDQKNAYTD